MRGNISVRAKQQGVRTRTKHSIPSVCFHNNLTHATFDARTQLFFTSVTALRRINIATPVSCERYPPGDAGIVMNVGVEGGVAYFFQRVWSKL